MNPKDLQTTLRLEPALRNLALRPATPLRYLEQKYDLPGGALSAWLAEWNGGAKELPASRLNEVKAKLGALTTVRVERAPGAVATKAPPAGRVFTTSSPAVAKPAPAAAPKVPAPAEPIIARPPPMMVDLGKWLDAQHAELRGRITSFLVKVTPELARSWLQLNHGNRKPSRAKIRRFAAAMRDGRWAINGETLKFSGSGRLLDGQSRLEAILLAGVPVELEVRAGLPDLAQQSMDTGELRRGTHTLEMLGEAYPSILSPAAKLLWLWSKGWLGSIPFGAPCVLENAELAPLLAQHPGLRASVGWTVSTGAKITRYLKHSEAAFFHYLLGTVDQAKRDALFEGVALGLGLSQTSPAYHLRERLADLRQGEDTGARKTLRRALIIKAWNCAFLGLRCSGLRHVEGDAFPELHGLPNPERQAGGFKRTRVARKEAA